MKRFARLAVTAMLWGSPALAQPAIAPYARLSNGAGSSISAADLVNQNADSASKVQALRGQLAPSHLWQVQMPFWGLISSATAISSPYTVGEDFSLDGPFTSVQLILANTSLSAQTLGGVLVAPSASLASKSNPVDQNGNTVAFTPETLSGSATITLPGAASATQPSVTALDPIPLESLARTDGGAFALLNTRVLVKSGTNLTAGAIPVNFPYAQYASDAGGREIHKYEIAADYVTTPAGLTDTTAGNYVDGAGQQFVYVVGVRFLSPSRVVTLMGVGDSLTAGALTATGFSGFGLRTATALSNQLGTGVSYEAHGYSGQVSADFVQNALNLIAIAPPSILTIPIDSPNDYTGLTTPAAIAAARAAMEQRILNLVDTSIQKGILPVVLSPIPFGTYDTAATYGPSRVISGNFARLVTQRGALVLDAQSIISGYVPTAANLPTLPAGLTASDGNHLNDAGQSLLASYLTALLAPRVQ